MRRIFKRLTSLVGIPLYLFVFFERAGGEGAAEREGDQVKSGDKAGILHTSVHIQYISSKIKIAVYGRNKAGRIMKCRARKEEYGHRVR